MTSEIMVGMNLKNIIAESRELHKLLMNLLIALNRLKRNMQIRQKGRIRNDT